GTSIRSRSAACQRKNASCTTSSASAAEPSRRYASEASRSRLASNRSAARASMPPTLDDGRPDGASGRGAQPAPPGRHAEGRVAHAPGGAVEDAVLHARGRASPQVPGLGPDVAVDHLDDRVAPSEADVVAVVLQRGGEDLAAGQASDDRGGRPHA